MKKNECIFCKIIAGEMPGVEIYRDETCIALMDIFPISPGHLMVIPLEHREFTHQLSHEVRAHIFEKASMLSKAVCRSELNSAGANILINDGKESGQHIPHVHIHVIPRYKKDLISVTFQIPTRFINPFARIGKQRRLQKMAGQIRGALSGL